LKAVEVATDRQTIKSVTAHYSDHHMAGFSRPFCNGANSKDDGPSGRRRPVTTTIGCIGAQKFRFSEYFPR
ncbi:hypothetical protein HAX54_001442, partial [Datura stramonium]|nr:hypothetical protein [Datura stramonium]